MIIPFIWEEISVTPTTHTARVKVPDGWLVMTVLNNRGSIAMNTTFIVDIEWGWEIE